MRKASERAGGGSAGLRGRRFDQFLPAHEIVRIGGQVGEPGQAQRRRQHVDGNPLRFRVGVDLGHIAAHHRNRRRADGFAQQPVEVRLILVHRDAESQIQADHLSAACPAARITLA